MQNNLIFLFLATAIPLNHNKNVDEEDWHLVPDAHGNMHLVDIRNNDIEEIAPLFNAFNDVVFRLFTRSNPTTPQFIQINNHGQLANSNFNLIHQTRFQIHGITNVLKFTPTNRNIRHILNLNQN